MTAMESLARMIYSVHRGTPQHEPWVLACLEGAWPHIVGGRTAAACRPVRFKDSEVEIEILDQAWEETFRNLKAQIEAKVRTATGGEVSTTKFTTRKGSTRSILPKV